MSISAAPSRSRSSAPAIELPLEGWVFVSVRDQDKAALVETVPAAASNGASSWWRHRGTANGLARPGLPVSAVNKVQEGRPHIVDACCSGEVQLVFNTTEGARRSPTVSACAERR